MKKLNRKILLTEILTATAISALAQSTQIKNPTALSEITGSPWGDLGFITTNNGLGATSLLDPYLNCSQTACMFSRQLIISGFNFTIPANATINGIKARVKRKSSVSNAIIDFTCNIKQQITSPENKAKSTPWPTTYAYQTYGGATAKWGLTWTPATINNPLFGLVFQCLNSDSVSMAEANIDHVQLTVYYNVGPVAKIQIRDVYQNVSSIKTFSDPVDDILNIELNLANETLVYLRVFNLEGRELITISENGSEGYWSKQVDISSLPDGIYMVRVETSDGVINQVKKVIK